MENKINLRKLFTTPYEYLPEFIDSNNCIYKITNLVNNKCYIGQARWLYDRLVGNSTSHLRSYVYFEQNKILGNLIYRAIRKYKSRSFTLEVLESNINTEELNEREIYWIEYYDSFHNGYNMTSGGENCENLHNPEVTNKMMETQYELYGCLACHKPESFERNRRNHGGVLAWNTKESCDYRKANSIFKSIWNKVEYLRSHNLDIIPFNYCYNTPGVRDIGRHINRVLQSLDYLITNEYLGPELKTLFTNIKDKGIPPRDSN